MGEPKIERTACCRKRLTPQVDDPEQPGEQERDRHGDDEIGIDPQARQKIAEQLLHDKGDIGADHDHLAMRHVDDAHHPKRDGQPDRGEQQHATKADALKQMSGEPGQPQAVVDRGERVVGRLAQPGIEVGLVAELVDEALHLRVGGAGERTDCRQLLVPTAGEQVHREEAELHRFVDLGILLGRHCLVEQCHLIGRGMLQDVLRRREPNVAIRAEQGQCSKRRLDQTAQPVVDDNALEAVGRDVL